LFIIQLKEVVGVSSRTVYIFKLILQYTYEVVITEP